MNNPNIIPLPVRRYAPIIAYAVLIVLVAPPILTELFGSIAGIAVSAGVGFGVGFWAIGRRVR